MANKTLEQKLVLREPGISGEKLGYQRVLFREDGAARKPIKDPGRAERYLTTLTGGIGSIATYYVDENQLFSYLFSSPRAHKSRIKGRTFHLDFTLKHCVADPALLVKHLHRDPLNLIEQEIKTYLSKAIEHLPWETILNEDTDFTAESLNCTRQANDGEVLSILEYMQRYANEFGLAVNDIEVECRLSEEALTLNNSIALREQELEEAKHKRKIEHQLAALQQTIDLQSIELDKEKAALEAQLNVPVKIHQALAGWAETLGDRFVEQTRSVPEMRRLIGELRDLLQSPSLWLASSPQGEWHAVPAQSSLGHDRQFDDAIDVAASDNITELVRRIEQASRRLEKASERKDLLAAAIHVSAEGQLDTPRRQDMQPMVKRLDNAWRQYADQLQDDTMLFERILQTYKQDD